MIILARPQYLTAPNLEEWVTLNRDALVGYWIDCDKAVILEGGPASMIGDYEDFVRSQWDQFNLDEYNDTEPRTLDDVLADEADSEDGVFDELA